MESRVSTAYMFMIYLLLSCALSEAQLSSTFYDKTCPKALKTVRSVVRSAVSTEKRMAASLIRLHFHDCFVQGCDASVLLEDSATIISEMGALPNKNSARGFNVITQAKSQVEKLCPGIVSCADILAIAAKDASQSVNRPIWTVKLGRKDSTTASKSLAESDLPFFKDSVETLKSRFLSKGLNERDMVALSGAHTIGQAQCATFRDRIYNNATSNIIDSGFATTRKRDCPLDKASGNANLAPFDLVTPTVFDNIYYKNLMQKKGLLESDQNLFSGGTTDKIVKEYSRSLSTFKSDFAVAIVKMGDIPPSPDSVGQIRKICSVVN